jgi:hypothetical protein
LRVENSKSIVSSIKVIPEKSVEFAIDITQVHRFVIFIEVSKIRRYLRILGEGSFERGKFDRACRGPKGPNLRTLMAIRENNLGGAKDEATSARVITGPMINCFIQVLFLLLLLVTTQSDGTNNLVVFTTLYMKLTET